MPQSRRQFGNIRKLPSGRHQASYKGLDKVRRNAPTTFDTKMDAEAWLTDVRRAMSRDEWTPDWGRRRPEQAQTFGPYARRWIEGRDIKSRTRAHYQRLLEVHLDPTFRDMPLTAITPEVVDAWYAKLGKNGTPTLRAHAYSLLRSILAQAATRREIPSNPCHIRGAGNAKRVHKVVPATVPEVGALADAMPVRYRAMILIAAWCGLRFGEITELRRKDIAMPEGVIRVRRGVVRVGGKFEVGTPKSEAGVRDVTIPPHIRPAVEAHLDSHVGAGADALLFPAASGAHLAQSTFTRSFYKAREAAGRPDLRFHDLRHTGAVLAASTGATLAELMDRLGHSTAGAAMRYQHAARDRDRVIAEALSALVLERPDSED